MFFLRLGLIILLLMAIFGIEDYLLFRWFISLTTLLLLVIEYNAKNVSKKIITTGTYIIIIILYNPIFPVYLHNRTSWIIIDIILITFLMSVNREQPENQTENEKSIKHIFSMPENQRRKYLDDSLKLDPLFNKDSFEKYTLFRDLEIKESYKYLEVEKMNKINIKQAIDEIMVPTGEINNSISVSHEFNRNELFNNKYQLGSNHVWRLYNKLTNETIGISCYINNHIEKIEGIIEKGIIVHEILILVIPEYLNKSHENIELKLLKEVENEAKKIGINKLSIDISKTDYVQFFFENGYREYFDWDVETIINKMENGTKTIMNLSKPTSIM